MEYLLTGTEMKTADLYAIEKLGFPSLVLMENAARAVADRIAFMDKKILVVCGTGNNGADGLAVCRILKIRGAFCDYRILGDENHASSEFQVQRNILEQLNYRPLRQCDFGEYDIIIDAVFGVGLKRKITGGMAECIDEINRSKAYRIAVDMPSGICADNGRIYGNAVKADETITFGFYKVGQVTYPGRTFCGKLILADIGYPYNLCQALGIKRRFCTENDLERLQQRDPAGHKGTFGKILLVAGSEDYCGAAILSGLAAYRSGAGMVKVVTHKENRTALCSRIPEALCLFYGDTPKEIPFSEEFVIKLEESIRWADVIAVGPGLSMDCAAEQLLTDVLQKSGEKPLILDADALNLLAKDRDKMERLLDKNMVLTPHVLEMSRLTGEEPQLIKQQPEETALAFARKYGCTVVLKDAVTIITDGTHIIYNICGNSGMAVAGSGDVLTGILSTYVFSDRPLWYTAAMGAFVHGRAGDAAAEQYGRHYMKATDIICGLREKREIEGKR